MASPLVGVMAAFPLVGVVMMASLLVGDAALAEVGAVSAVPAEILLRRIRRSQSRIPPLSLPGK